MSFPNFRNHYFLHQTNQRVQLWNINTRCIIVIGRKEIIVITQQRILFVINPVVIAAIELLQRCCCCCYYCCDVGLARAVRRFNVVILDKVIVTRKQSFLQFFSVLATTTTRWCSGAAAADCCSKRTYRCRPDREITACLVHFRPRAIIPYRAVGILEWAPIVLVQTLRDVPNFVKRDFSFFTRVLRRRFWLL